MIRGGSELPEVRTAVPGRKSRELTSRLLAVESPATDARRSVRARESSADQSPIIYASALGSNVVDVDGNRYVDLAAGFGALLLGHARAEVISAYEEQHRRLGLALGDVFASEAKVALCERLAALYPAPGARVLLGSSGADAVTAAMKTAVLATGRPGVLAFEGSYHGLSYGPLAACGLRASFRQPFAEQLSPHVTFAPYPRGSTDESMAVVTSALAGGNVGAVLVEPILGRGGCLVPPDGFLASLRAACDASGVLLVCDEIWTGLGRSGAWLASVDEGVLPDVVCLGKGLGGGLPISACIASDRVMAAWGSHGGTTIHTATHFGAPPVCAAALATLAVLEREKLPQRARSTGTRWMDRIRVRTTGCGVREVRGRGLMVGVVVDGGAGRALRVTSRLLAKGWIVLTGGATGDALTLTPPLDVDDALLDAFADALAAALSS